MSKSALTHILHWVELVSHIMSHIYVKRLRERERLVMHPVMLPVLSARQKLTIEEKLFFGKWIV